MRKILILIFFINSILYSEIIKVKIEKDIFVSKGSPEIPLNNLKFYGIRSWYSYYLFKIDTEYLKEKIKDKKIKDAYFNFYISWIEVYPNGFSPSETKSEIQFYPILTKWEDIKWNLQRGKEYSEKPVVIYKIENKYESEIKGRKRISGFGEIIKSWCEGDIENNGILMMIVQAEENKPYLIQINIHTSKEEDRAKIPYFEIDIE